MTIIYILLIIAYTILSYAKTDPNLVYSYHPTFIRFQEFMWQLGYENRLLFTIIYTAIIIGLFYFYLRIINQVRQKNISSVSAFKLSLGSAVILIFANPALSHDIFNYIFNAKMILLYKANPHMQTALQFSSDPWVQFMHNTHTPAPYGYGWTGLSMIPYWLGFGRLKITLLSFKVFIGSFFFLLLYFQKKLQKILKIKNNYGLFIFALNPLVLIETFGNGHNDVVMMGSLFMGIYLILSVIPVKARSSLVRNLTTAIFGLLFIALSISIKLASIMIIPGLLLMLFSEKLKKKKIGFGQSNALTHSLPLLTSRSQRFLPWYTIWSFSFTPFIKNKFILTILIAFTFSGLMRHIPALYFPIHEKPISDEVFKTIEQIITFSIPLMAMLIYKIKTLKNKQRLT